VITSRSISRVRVRYAETDTMGVVYYANYLVWFEVARTDLLRHSGWSYREMEVEGFSLPVIEAHCEYKQPARYDDEVEVRSGGDLISPIRVRFAPTHAANFQPAFLDAVRAAFGLWTHAGVPVRFEFDADSTKAEVTLKWRIQFEIERTGQTDVTWDDQGHIQSAVVTLATFDPKGRPMEPDDIRVVAMHEVGHVLGLDHSKDSTDIMFPTAKVRELSDRDVRTVRLLYELTPGSVR